MNKRNLRLVMSLVAALGLVPAWACSSNNDSGGSTSGTTSSSGTSKASTSSGTSSGTTGSSSTGPGTTVGDGGCTATTMPAATPPNAGPVLDDMSGQQSQTGGSWYTYSARTVPNSEPPILVNMTGSLTPLEGQQFLPDNTGASTCVPPFAYDNSGNFHYREFSGNMVPAWGAGFGFDLMDNLPDGGPVAFNSCDAGTIFDTNPDAGNVGIPQPFDGSQYAGFSFWGISLTATKLNVEVHVDDKSTDPWGGVCNVCINGGKCAGGVCPCSDNFIETVAFQPGIWKQFTVTFTDAANFKVANWSTEGHLVFDPTTMYNIHFQITAPGTMATPAFDIAVADLVWIAK